MLRDVFDFRPETKAQRRVAAPPVATVWHAGTMAIAAIERSRINGPGSAVIPSLRSLLVFKSLKAAAGRTPCQLDGGGCHPAGDSPLLDERLVFLTETRKFFRTLLNPRLRGAGSTGNKNPTANKHQCQNSHARVIISNAVICNKRNRDFKYPHKLTCQR